MNILFQVDGQVWFELYEKQALNLIRPKLNSPDKM
jgi:hypothetical protein